MFEEYFRRCRQKNVVFHGVINRLKNDREGWLKKDGKDEVYCYEKSISDGIGGARVTLQIDNFSCKVEISGRIFKFGVFGGFSDIIDTLYFTQNKSYFFQTIAARELSFDPFAHSLF